MMPTAEKTSLSTRLSRTTRLLYCLFSAARALRKQDPADQDQLNQTLNRVSASMLYVLNAQLVFDHKQNPAGGPEPISSQGLLVVANHVSWLDIFALCTLYPSSFIAMQEIKKWPWLGKIARNAGTVFINRRNKKDVDAINSAISATLSRGQNVAFFPEAQTSIGLNVLPFKAALFQSAINTQAPIQPVALRYYDQHNQRTTLPSFADANLLQSFWRILSMPEIRIRVDRGHRILPQQQPQADRFMLKDQAESFVRQQVEDSNSI